VTVESTLSKLRRFIALFSSTAAAMLLTSAACATGVSRVPGAETHNTATQVKIGTVVKDCAECPEMVAVPQVGHTAESPGKILYVARYELTWREYVRSVRAGACEALHWRELDGDPWPPSFLYMQEDSPLNSDHPVTGVRLKDFNCYVAWLKSKSGKTYRVPTGPEWVHFTLAGAKTRYPWGNDLEFDKAMLWYIRGGGRPNFLLYDRDRLLKKFGYPRRNEMRDVVKWESLWPVGGFPPNAWGLYDVIGNAAETTSEMMPPSPGCVKLYGVARCRAFVGRGSSSGLEWVLKNPSARNLVLVEDSVSAEGTSTDQGYRLVRD
jgi:formylglycine-generating enzyme required for sulfatase activity